MTRLPLVIALLACVGCQAIRDRRAAAAEIEYQPRSVRSYFSPQPEPQSVFRLIADRSPPAPIPLDEPAIHNAQYQVAQYRPLVFPLARGAVRCMREHRYCYPPAAPVEAKLPAPPPEIAKAEEAEEKLADPTVPLSIAGCLGAAMITFLVRARGNRAF